MSLYPELEKYIEGLVGRYGNIPEARKKDLETVSDFISNRINEGRKARLTFICTHNSRRSHMGQIWAHTGAAYFGLTGIETFSGGTEATAFNPNAVQAMRNAGFQIDSDGVINPSTTPIIPRPVSLPSFDSQITTFVGFAVAQKIEQTSGIFLIEFNTFKG